jgi:hypothetical protein
MSKLKIIGWISWISGALLIGFQTISMFMGAEEKVEWKNLAIVDVAEEKYLHWIDNIPWVNVQEAVNYVVNMPLYLFLFCFGILCFLISALTPKR